MAGGQKEKCVTNVETAPENNTVGVNGREARLILMRITNPRHTLLLHFQDWALLHILQVCVRVRLHLSHRSETEKLSISLTVHFHLPPIDEPSVLFTGSVDVKGGHE